jgi:hypothetical protein
VDTREDCLAAAGLDLAALRTQIAAWWPPIRPKWPMPPVEAAESLDPSGLSACRLPYSAGVEPIPSESSKIIVLRGFGTILGVIAS